MRTSNGSAIVTAVQSARYESSGMAVSVEARSNLVKAGASSKQTVDFLAGYLANGPLCSLMCSAGPVAVARPAKLRMSPTCHWDRRLGPPLAARPPKCGAVPGESSSVNRANCVIVLLRTSPSLHFHITSSSHLNFCQLPSSEPFLFNSRLLNCFKFYSESFVSQSSQYGFFRFDNDRSGLR